MIFSIYFLVCAFRFQIGQLLSYPNIDWKLIDSAFSWFINLSFEKLTLMALISLSLSLSGVLGVQGHSHAHFLFLFFTYKLSYNKREIQIFKTELSGRWASLVISKPNYTFSLLPFSLICLLTYALLKINTQITKYTCLCCFCVHLQNTNHRQYDRGHFFY